MILIKLFGALNDKTLLDLVTSVVKQTQNVPDIKEFIDCRNISNLDVTVHGLRETANYVGYKPEWLLALLINDEPILQGMAEGYRATAVDYRKEVRILTDLDEAASWVAQGDDELTRTLIALMNEGVESFPNKA